MITISRPGRNALALAAVCLTSLMSGLEISSVPVILPTLEKVLHSSFRDEQWVMNAYTIACTTVLMATGTLADKYGRKRMLTISLLLFGIASLFCGLAQNITVLIISRFVQGMGGGAMLICLIAVLSQQFREGKERSRAFAAWGIVFGAGLGFGPVIGGLIVAVFNWQWVFLVHVPFTVLTLLLVLSNVEESKDPQAKKLDLWGILSLSAVVLGITFLITQGQSLDVRSAIFISIATLLSFIVFLYVEKTTPYPMFDFSVFRIGKFSGAIMGSIGMNFSFWPFMIYLPIYFQSGLGYGAVGAGLSLLAYTLPALVFPPVGERLATRYKPAVIIPLGMFIIGVGFLLMKLGSAAAEASWLTMLPGSLLAGTGLGITNTPVTNTTTGSVSANRAGMASGIDVSARLITLAINIALMGFILLAGILSYLKDIFPATTDMSLQPVAEKIAGGNVAGVLLSGQQVAASHIQASLTHGFGWVLLYGGIGAWVLAIVSFFIFRFGNNNTAV